MKSELKILINVLYWAFVGFLANLAYTSVQAGYLQSSNFLNVLFIALGFGALIFVGVRMNTHWFNNISLLMLLIAFQGCSYSKANVKTLVSDDCGINWKLIPSGKAIPRGGVNPCYMKVTLPDVPMSGEVTFKAKFKGGVLAYVNVAYIYTIQDGAKYLSEARYLGKVNTDGDDETNKVDNFEVAENTVIERRIRSVATENFINVNVIDLNPNDLEMPIQEAVNQKLAGVGIVIESIEIVPTFSDQTETAIDVVTAHRVYELNGLKEVGEKVIVARSGAANISQSVKQEKNEPAD